MKKGYATQKIWIYIMLTIALAVVIVLMYKGIVMVKDKQNDISLYIFFEKFERAVESASPNYGSVNHNTFQIGNQYSKICFAEYGIAVSDGITNPEVYDAVNKSLKKNVFVFNNNDVFSHYVPGIMIENLSSTKYGCLNISGGEVLIRLEARGTGTVIGYSNESLNFEDCVIPVPDIMSTGELEPTLWNYSAPYFYRNSDGNITRVCGPNGWEDIQVVVH